MTDDQLDRLIEAISSPMNLYVTVGIALLSAVLGFVGGVAADAIARRRQASASAASERRARDAIDTERRLSVATDAAAWALRLAGMPGSHRQAVLAEWSKENGVLLARLSEFDGYNAVGG